ncbi:unnamed protein product [Orchesella dallaii]|uniref:Uncharacterized protein n=1 Tax=Orchesella dallaii TaxID=48710 RepID=A0ABP1RZV2_9HEXA
MAGYCEMCYLNENDVAIRSDNDEDESDVTTSDTGARWKNQLRIFVSGGWDAPQIRLKRDNDKPMSIDLYSEGLSVMSRIVEFYCYPQNNFVQVHKLSHQLKVFVNDVKECESQWKIINH